MNRYLHRQVNQRADAPRGQTASWRLAWLCPAHPFVFRVTEARVKTLAEASRDKLAEVKAEEKPEPEPAAEGGEAKPEANAPIAEPQPDVSASNATGG